VAHWKLNRDLKIGSKQKDPPAGNGEEGLSNGAFMASAMKYRCMIYAVRVRCIQGDAAKMAEYGRQRRNSKNYGLAMGTVQKSTTKTSHCLPYSAIFAAPSQETADGE